MQPKDKVRLRHMLDASKKAVEFCAGKTEINLAKDEMLRLAVVRLVEVIGEAAKKCFRGHSKFLSSNSMEGNCRNPRPPHSWLF